jgi:phenylacetic acid degradation protein
LYKQLPKECHESLKEVDPLREIPTERPKQGEIYKTLREQFKK